VLGAIFIVAAEWLLLWFMYKKKVFVKV